MTEEEIKEIRKKDVVEVTVHGQTTKMFSVEGLEKEFKKEYRDERVVVPSTDILRHHQSLPLDVTQQEAMEAMTEEFNKLTKPKEKELQLKEIEIDSQLKHLKENRQNEPETLKNIVHIVKDSVIPVQPNIPLTQRMEREIREALRETDPELQKLIITENLKSIIHGGAEIQLLTKQQKTKVKWGALGNRKGCVGENKVALAVNHVMEDFRGMSVMGMKTHTYLYDFLEKLNIQFTYKNVKDPITRKFKEMGEVEHDHISTWLEEEALVVNLIQCKTMEVKPWNPPDPARRGQAAFKHAKHGLLQLVKDFLTFKEMLPDIKEADMRRIR